VSTLRALGFSRHGSAVACIFSLIYTWSRLPAALTAGVGCRLMGPAASVDAWFVTGGTNAGIMKHMVSECFI
jgi:hypothetical protein